MLLLCIFAVAGSQRAFAQEAEPARSRSVVFLPPQLAELFGPGTGAPIPPASQPTSLPIPGQSPTSPVSPLRAISGAFVPDEVLVTIDGDGAAVAAIAAQYGLEVRSARVSTLLGRSVVRFGIPDGRAVAAVLAQLDGDGRLSASVPNHLYRLQQLSGGASYVFSRIALDAEAASGADVSLAVIDTAADLEHPALAGAIAETFDAMPDRPVKDRDHGTSISGLIAGRGDFQGIARGARLYHARAFEEGISSTEILLAALDWAARSGAQIVNMSFVGPENSLFAAACRNASARGIVLVAAAGNDGPGAPFAYPAAYEGVIAVTATDVRDRLMREANRGRYIDLSAPGVNVMVPVPGGMDALTGTSFAAAVVSGAIANLLGGRGTISPDDVAKALGETAVDLGEPGRDDAFGNGLLNMAAARERLR